MRINHNAAAMNTQSRLASAQGSQAKSLEKLSSGLRINRAGDDAAGLAISEKMRGQISGLNQASRNAQDGISLIQTAEGGLNETHSILQRMRELAVQSSNDTNSADDRVEIQKEIKQLNSEIDRISNNTEFNTQKLLNGSLGASGTSSNANNLVVKSAAGLKEGVYTVTVGTAATKASQVSTSYAAEGDIIAAFENKDITINGVKIDTVGADSGAKILEAINKEKEATGFEATWTAGSGVTLTATEFGSGKDLTIGGGEGVAALTTGGSAFVAGKDAIVTITDENQVSEVKTGVGKVVEYRGAELEVTLAADFTVKNGGATLHIGANKDQNISVSVNEMSTKTLGDASVVDGMVEDIDVSTQEGANKAIKTVDEAIKSVSSERSKLGSIQNRLDHTINNLTTTSENLSAAESRIRDVDMAKEMMTFTKNNILSQASTAMLAQANQMPQGVLQLLG